MPSHSSPFASKSYRALLGAQFLGAYNDNLFKMLVSLMAVDAAAGAIGAGGYLSLTGIVFIVPYLLFSGYAGDVADRFGKRNVLVVTKGLEVGIMVLALIAFLLGDVTALLAVLFLLAAQATFFSPAKFGVLPEMLPAGQLAQANGYLEMARYIAVILGSVSAGGLLVACNGDPWALGGVLIAVAIVGSVVCLAVKPSGAVVQPAPLKLNPFASIFRGVRLIMADKPLRNAVAGITYFESLAALVMMDVLLVGQDVLGLDEFGSGSLLAIAGIGIGIGAAVAGRLSVGRINLALTLPASAGVAASLLILSLCDHNYIETAILIGCVGVFGGLFMVPLNAQVQHLAGAGEKGVTISANNFLNMTGALAACGLLWVTHDVMGIAADDVILVAGAIATAATLLQLHFAGGIGAALGRLPQLSGRRQERSLS
jgi:acyl-[acyl-carrier-protein]-phospholipid O-acyltransferase / long-chain-fatty-acid--[acyl-carrier-protein] ligase